jgi:hypothetical protein
MQPVEIVTPRCTDTGLVDDEERGTLMNGHLSFEDLQYPQHPALRCLQTWQQLGNPLTKCLAKGMVSWKSSKEMVDFPASHI